MADRKHLAVYNTNGAHVAGFIGYTCRAFGEYMGETVMTRDEVYIYIYQYDFDSLYPPYSPFSPYSSSFPYGSII